MRTSNVVAILLLSALLGSACGTGTEAVPSQPPPAAEATSVIMVTTAPATTSVVATLVKATGTFVADETSEVTPQVSGQVVATPVNVGDIVDAGQILVRLDDRDATLKLRQAEASLQQAEAQAARARAEATRNAELVHSGDISRSSFEQLTTQVTLAEAGVAQARVQVATAQKGIDDTTIRAPFAGHISARPVARGEYVSTAAKVATVVRITPIKLQLLVPQAEAAILRKGLTVFAEVPAFPGKTFSGTVSALNVAIDPVSRAMTIDVVFPNRDAVLSPGMFGSAEVRLAATEPALFVPEAAVVPLPNGESFAVYTVDSGVARMRVVQTGDRRAGQVRILAGLDAGAIVVTTGVAQLFDGARVRVDGQPAVNDGSARPKGTE